MRQVFETPRFKRTYRRFVKSHRETLRQMGENVHAQSLKTHRLEGKLLGLQACSCGYDCRIVFSIEPVNEGELIVLYSIGTHGEVY